MVIILMGLIVFGAILIVGYPLVNARGYEYAQANTDAGDNFEHLASARNSAFEAIRDLEFDRATDKLSEADYKLMRARFDAKAAEVMQKMDALGAAKAKRVAKEAEAATGEPVVKRQASRSAPERGFCPHCGAHRETTDRFCLTCGTRLT